MLAVLKVEWQWWADCCKSGYETYSDNAYTAKNRWFIQKEQTEAHFERSDTCAVPACAVVAEARIAWILVDELLEKFGGDSLNEIKKNYENNIILLGMMGAGKSSIGKKLKEVLTNFTFIDVDDYIENKADMKISDILPNIPKSILEI